MAAQTIIYVATPTTPDFIRVGKDYVPIGDLSDETLRRVAQDWTNQLLQKAKTQRLRKEKFV